MGKKVLIVGSGLGGLSTALRLACDGYQVEILEKYHQAGGRLNQLKMNGFIFDIAPTFFSMSYEFDELIRYCGITKPFEFVELDPLYSVHFEGDKKNYLIYKNPEKLAAEFRQIEPGFKKKLQDYLRSCGDIFHDTENIVIRRNYSGIPDYLFQLAKVPPKHAPKMFRSMWQELERYFDSYEVKVIFSLVSFFLGGTPFDTPSVFSMLNYTELVHDGYHNVKGGMYKIVEGLLRELKVKDVSINYGIEINGFKEKNNLIEGLKDTKGNLHQADIYVINADAASFRGEILGRKKYSEENLDRKNWTMGPLTIYLGIDGKVDNMYHHNYFLRKNFEDYSGRIFKNAANLDKPYYYVNIQSMHNPEYAPEGKESIFILCPVPNLINKPDWHDADAIADKIIEDLSERTGFSFGTRIEEKLVLSPANWQKMFNLYKGSGLGLAHNLGQVGGFRPSNKDEKFRNLYYVGASTIPGTGLPMVVISSKLVTERINREHGTLQN
jgi:phytoene desaturase